MLGSLVATAVSEGLLGLSLSVERDPAARLYQRLGFVEVAAAEGPPRCCSSCRTDALSRASCRAVDHENRCGQASSGLTGALNA